MSQSVKVVVSGAAGQIAYSLLPLICNGLVFGPTCRVELRMLDIAPMEEAMEGVKMELQDCAYNLVDKIIPTSDLERAFTGADAAILVGGFPRKAGMERKELIEKNVTIFKAQGEAIGRYAKPTIKVLVVANPANTNCYAAMKYAQAINPAIPRTNFSALTRLDHERLRAFLVERVNTQLTTPVTSKDVRKCVIWGNHSSTQVPDCTNVGIVVAGKESPLATYVQDKEWIETTLVKDVQQRGAAIIKARKFSSAMSAAAAAGAHMRDWFYGTPPDDYVSMAICSDKNPYNVAEDLIFSFPVRCLGNGQVEIVGGLPISDRIAGMIKATTAELQAEKAEAMGILEPQGARPAV